MLPGARRHFSRKAGHYLRAAEGIQPGGCADPAGGRRKRGPRAPGGEGSCRAPIDPGECPRGSDLDGRPASAGLLRPPDRVRRREGCGGGSRCALPEPGDPFRDSGTRFQVLGGLAGIWSATLTGVAPPEGPIIFGFIVERDFNAIQGPFEASLKDAARMDPVVGAAVVTTLGSHSEEAVREIAAQALRDLSAPGADDALRSSARGDREDSVRAASLTTLAESKGAGISGLAMQLVLEDESPIVQSTALLLLSQKAPQDPQTQRFLVDCLTLGRPAKALSALADSSFHLLRTSPTRELQEGLSMLLLHRAGADPDLADVFVKEAVAGGLPQFMPLFRLLESSLPAESPIRDTLRRGAQKLEEAPRYAALAEQIREGEKQVRVLYDEVNRPGTTEERSDSLAREIGSLIERISESRKQLEK